MKPGDIVLVKDFEFLDGNSYPEPEKKCIILFNEIINDENFYYVCPIVSQLSSFNKNPDSYYLLPLTNKSGRKLCFAKLSSPVLIKENQIVNKTGNLSVICYKRMLEKLKLYINNYGINEYNDNIINRIEEKKLTVN